jgi:hypothetical protein
MKNLRNILFILTFSLLIALVGCKKESTTTTTTDPSAQATAMQNNYKAATANDALLVNFHQHTGSGSHDSCYYYWHQFNQYDSLFSYYFYDYCRHIYSNNGGKNYGMGGWNWEMEHGNSGYWDEGNWQCGLDSLQFQNWQGFGDCWSHDSTMYHKMQGYNMTGYFSSQASQCFNNMQSMRYNHYHHHNYHW